MTDAWCVGSDGDRTESSRQLAAQWSTATRVSLCASSIRRRLLQRGLRAMIPFYMIPLTHNHRRLRLQWANVHRSWRVDWQQVVFSDESRFNWWHQDGRIRVRRYAGERHIPECIIERHSTRTPGVMFGLAIHQNDHQVRRRFVKGAQNEIAVVPDFHKRILFSDEAHFWLNGYVNKQNCRIWSEANPQVYVETPLHAEKLTVWCAL
ncbi:transposable element Tc1 transposase [Trichonephila clavipes]|uniref:Transposable element Tc1 transposase n=1 Tax=Trichonephila clavipes TaxID=2585209 RepID=A0A8X6RCK6_TRICX|nr:transposable element Tc1 transposase [Trichonephila clavipes]